MILVDSSFYISLARNDDPNHKRAIVINQKIKEQKTTTEDILKESLTVISQRNGKEAAIYFYEMVHQDTKVFPVESLILAQALHIFFNLKLNKNISVVDCTTVAICKNEGIKKILTFDRHFKKLGLEVIH